VADVSLGFRGFYAEGDVVVVEVRMQATLAHGGHYDNDYCFIFEMRNGLVARVREYMDTQRGAAWFNAPAHDRPGEPRGVPPVAKSGGG
jgi:uncharacterized protein